MTSSAFRSALITGTSTGIGRATAGLLDREGWRVFAGVRRDEDGESLRAECSERVRPVLLDVTQQASIEQAAKEVDQALDGDALGAVVNNAGIGFGGPLEFADVEEMRRGFEVNVFGPTAVIQAFLPLLRRGPGGRIVNVSSAAGRMATPLLGPYSASKFALEALSDALRIELRGAGMHVSVIEPGFIDTPMQDKGRTQTAEMRDELPEEGRQRYAKAIAKFQENLESFGKRAAPAEKVAAAILDALTASRPSTRTTVGGDAKLSSAIARLLPDRARDAVLGRISGL